MSGLASEPSTVTQVSKRLGVSKSTASYHISLLLQKGMVKLMDPKERKGSARMKLYGLKEGSQFIMMTEKDEETELGRLRETFDLTTLSWRASGTSITFDEIQNLLYRMYLRLFRIARGEHKSLMIEYGNRVGAMIFLKMPAPSLRESLLRITASFKNSGISDADIIDLQGPKVSVIASNTCIGSEFHPSNSCYFLEGMIEGAIHSKIGRSISVERVTVPGLSNCLIAVGRLKHLGSQRLAEKILASSNYSTSDRRSAKG